MASIILKKRKLCEAIEESLQITPSTYEVKKRIDENGEYRMLYESILPNLKALFPDQDDGYLMETLKANKNDIISTIECLKYRKPQSPTRTVPNVIGVLDPTTLSALEHLAKCDSQQTAYAILAEFKKQAADEANKNKLRTEAENMLLRKAFKIQRAIIHRETAKSQESEKVAEKVVEEIEKVRLVNTRLAMKLEQLEKSQMQSLWNNHIC